MSIHAKHSWFRHAIFTGAILGIVGLAIGLAPRTAAAQYRYPGAAYSSYPYAHPAHSYPSYDHAYQRRSSWGARHGGWDRGWRGAGQHQGNSGNGNAYMGWLGAHATYR